MAQYGIAFALVITQSILMNKSLKVIAGLAILTAASMYIIRRINTRRVLTQVADDGYETAHDVLFPDKKIRSRKVHYGPIHPKMN